MNYERLPHEQLITNHEQLHDPYAVTALLQQLRPVAHLVMTDMASAKGDIIPMKSAQRQNFISEKVPVANPSNQAVSYVISLYEQSIEEEPLHQFIDELAKRTNLRIDETTVPSIEAAISDRNTVERRAKDVVQAIEYISDDSVEDQYAVAKMLATHPADIIDDTEHVVIRDFAVIAAMQDETDLFGENIQRIEQGEYDQHIAKDLLLEHIRGDTQSLGKQTDREIDNLLKLTSRLMGGDAVTQDVVDKLAEPDSLVLWPQEARRLYESKKEQLVESLHNRFEYCSHVAYAKGYVTPLVTERDLAVLVDMHSADLKIHIRHNPQKARMEEVQRAGQKRARVGKNAGKAATKQAARSKAEKEAPPRTLVFAKKSGERFEEGSDEFNKMLHDYISRHPGQGLDTAVPKILDYLRNPTQSNGLNDGVRIVKGDTMRYANDPANPRKLYRLRPNQATGLKLSTVKAQKTRVFFTKDKSDPSLVVITGIADKPSSGLLLKSLNFRAIGNVA